MSDSVSNADIEDVLSSIRRLVSEEPKSAATRLRESEPGEQERFVLTPAFRVPEDQQTAELHHLETPSQAAPVSSEPIDLFVDQFLCPRLGQRRWVWGLVGDVSTALYDRLTRPLF